jgi:hypothetical protein
LINPVAITGDYNKVKKKHDQVFGCELTHVSWFET